jgi:L-ascorbate metabolism protein UlaG (beta-lactamase superfamily)
MFKKTLIFAALIAPIVMVSTIEGSAQSNKIEVLWLGQSAFKITTPGGKVIAVDPWLANNPTTPPQYKNIDALGKVDLILVSHAHYDHFEDAPALAKKNNVPLYGPAGLNQALLTLGILPAELVPRFNDLPIPRNQDHRDPRRTLIGAYLA